MTTPRHRELIFTSQAEVLAEAERLAASNPSTTGGHSFAEIVRHLALANDMVTGRIVPPKPPLLLHLVMPLMRARIFRGPVKPGFKLPRQAEAFFWPSDPIDVDDALATLRDSMDYYQQHGPLPVHPVFGKATREQIDQLTLRHAAMHLGFVHASDNSEQSGSVAEGV